MMMMMVVVVVIRRVRKKENEEANFMRHVVLKSSMRNTLKKDTTNVRRPFD